MRTSIRMALGTTVMLAAIVLLVQAIPVRDDGASTVYAQGACSQNRLNVVVVELVDGVSVDDINAKYGTTIWKRFPGTNVYVLNAETQIKKLESNLNRDKNVIWAERGKYSTGLTESAQFASASTDGFTSASLDGFTSAALEGFTSASLDGFTSAALDGFTSSALDGFQQVALDGFTQAAIDGF
ncbi:MAG: hypothetical protein IIB17_03205, partial [Chloroflexi bacterium]|nr:hypothetical protein [Chloroflexota bacterium]